MSIVPTKKNSPTARTPFVNGSITRYLGIASVETYYFYDWMISIKKYLVNGRRQRSAKTMRLSLCGNEAWVVRCLTWPLIETGIVTERRTTNNKRFNVKVTKPSYVITVTNSSKYPKIV